MIKNILKSKEPVVYTSLYNDLKNNKVSHSYLFVGEYNPLKLDTAYLLAQSIIEGKNDFACEECSTCKRIKEGNYVDFRYIDGYDHSIKKEEMEEVMESFKTTALEKANKKVYIVSNINNSNKKVLNMILKFIEEPINNTYAIFMSDNEESLLPTIVSRCQKIRFKQRDFSFLVDEYKKNGFSDDDAYILSCIKHSVDKDVIENNEPYNNAKNIAYEIIDNLENKDYIPVLLGVNFEDGLDKKESIKESIEYFIEIMLQMLEDSISLNSIDDDTYNLKLGVLNKNNPEKLLNIFVEAKNKCYTSVNKQLLLNHIACEIIK